jgi:formylglycine-generating enzyme required for sulfatase activity
MRQFRFTFLSLALVTSSFSLIPTKAYCETYPHGDFSKSWTVELGDALLLADILIKGEEVKWYHDVNWDYRVDINDVVCVIDYLLTNKWNIPSNPPEIPDSAEVFTVNGVTFAMMPVEGCQDWEVYENVTYLVSLNDYYMGQTEVTYEMWEAVMGEPRTTTSVLVHPGDPQHPVDDVSWFDCRDFITRLNELTGRRFHLPTHAQWIWAAQGGKYSQGYTYSGSNDLDEVGWYCDDQPYEDSWDISFAVGQKKPNELGLYDMSGNVREWVRNYFVEDGDALPDVSQDSDLFEYGYLKGGNSTDIPIYCTAGYHLNTYRGSTGRLFGFRLALQKED